MSGGVANLEEHLGTAPRVRCFPNRSRLIRAPLFKSLTVFRARKGSKKCPRIRPLGVRGVARHGRCVRARSGMSSSCCNLFSIPCSLNGLLAMESRRCFRHEWYVVLIFGRLSTRLTNVRW